MATARTLVPAAAVAHAALHPAYATALHDTAALAASRARVRLDACLGLAHHYRFDCK